MFGGIGYLVFERRARRDERRRKQHSKFADVLQLARTESEAHQVVKRYLERVVPRSTATVLNRNSSANRLEATTEVGDPVLLEALVGAEPEACLAIRGGRTHQRHDEGAELMLCEICGVSAGNATCVPSLVGGEAIGSVLVQHPTDSIRRMCHTSLRASPRRRLCLRTCATSLAPSSAPPPTA